MLCNFAAVNISCTEFDISISPTQCSILLLSHPTIEPGRSPKNEEDKWIRQFNKNRTGKVCKVLLCWLNVHIEYIDSCDYIKYEIHKYSLQCQVHCEFRRESRISLSSSLSFSLHRPPCPNDNNAVLLLLAARYSRLRGGDWKWLDESSKSILIRIWGQNVMDNLLRFRNVTNCIWVNQNQEANTLATRQHRDLVHTHKNYTYIKWQQTVPTLSSTTCEN